MKRSKIQPRYTTFRQKQKSHFTPKYNACLQCGCNTEKTFSILGKEAEKDVLIAATIRRFGYDTNISTNSFPIFFKEVSFCGMGCLKRFIKSHKLDLLEEITK